jgi:hypothetical protein
MIKTDNMGQEDQLQEKRDVVVSDTTLRGRLIRLTFDLLDF